MGLPMTTYSNRADRGDGDGGVGVPAEGGAPGDDLVGLLDVAAELDGAVADAVAKVYVAAQAGDVARVAAQLRGLVQHVGGACFLS